MINASSKKQAGFSLLELLLVVAVGAVLILAGLGAYKLVSEGNAATQGIRQLQTLKQQVQQAFQGESNYGAAGGDMTAVLQSLRMLPPDMPLNGANLRNSFGGNTTVVTGAAPGDTFIITFNNVSTNACTKMAQTYSYNNASDLVSLTINGTLVPNNANAFNVAQLTGANFCGNVAANNNHVLIWRFQ